MGFHVKTPKRSSGAREFVREHPEEARVAVCTGLTLSRPSCRWLRAHRAADGRRSDEESCCRRAFGKTIQAGHTDVDGLVYASRLTGEDVYAVMVELRRRAGSSNAEFVRRGGRASDPATSKCESSALIAPCEPRYSSQLAATCHWTLGLWVTMWFAANATSDSMLGLPAKSRVARLGRSTLRAKP